MVKKRGGWGQVERTRTDLMRLEVVQNHGWEGGKPHIPGEQKTF